MAETSAGGEGGGGGGRRGRGAGAGTMADLRQDWAGAWHGLAARRRAGAKPADAEAERDLAGDAEGTATVRPPPYPLNITLSLDPYNINTSLL